MPFEFTEKAYYGEHFKQLTQTEKEFSDISFEDCSFESCDFSESYFSNCHFLECDFSNCNLSLVSLQDCRLNEVVFKQCKLLGIDWTRVRWPSIALDSQVVFEQSVLNDSSFFALQLQGLKIIECRCKDVDFTQGDFNAGSFSHSDLSGSLFSRTNLSGVDFSEASNYRIDIENNNIKGAKFSRFEAVRLLEGFDIELVD